MPPSLLFSHSIQLCTLPVIPSFSHVHFLLLARLQSHFLSHTGLNRTLSCVAQVHEQYLLLPGVSFGTASAGLVETIHAARKQQDHARAKRTHPHDGLLSCEHFMRGLEHET